jgi:hypothetical protein
MVSALEAPAAAALSSITAADRHVIVDGGVRGIGTRTTFRAAHTVGLMSAAANRVARDPAAVGDAWRIATATPAATVSVVIIIVVVIRASDTNRPEQRGETTTDEASGDGATRTLQSAEGSCSRMRRNLTAGDADGVPFVERLFASGVVHPDSHSFCCTFVSFPHQHRCATRTAPARVEPENGLR